MKPLAEISILMISTDPGLLKHGDEIDVAQRHRAYAGHLKRLDIIVIGNGAVGISDLADNCRAYGLGNNIFSMVRAFSWGKKLFAKYKYDLIDCQDPHATGLVGSWLARRFQKPLEVHFHGDFWDNDYWLRESWKNPIYNIIQKKVVRQAQGIRVVSQKIKDKLVASGMVSDKIEVINTPINEKIFALSPAGDKVREIQNKYGKKILLFVGRLVAAKNLLFMVQTIKELKKRRDDFVLLIIGEGNQRGHIHTLIDQNYLPEQVYLLGEKEQQLLVDYYQAAYLLLLLSTNESFGKVIIEAGLRGTPTLASHTLGASTIIDDEQTGWLVGVNNLKQTVDKLDLLLSEHDLVKLTGSAAQKKYAASYSQALAERKIFDFWQRLAG
ncbi:MAG: hypothetical protein C3F02_00385 [Parcubacteria group bacterium]|nr:MAG: hypothetical protein C3F02_00385 [Parcubacteria group bacterium]